MNCEQKSGVLLNLSCLENEADSCTNCNKKVCEIHSHKVGNSTLCEDCYWESYLLHTEDKRVYYSDSEFDDDYSESSSFENVNPSSGFYGGFGGGRFGGGGAAGFWSEADMQSTENNNEDLNGGLLTDDSSFHYS